MKREFSFACLLAALSLCNAAGAQVNTTPYEFIEIFRIGDEASADSIFFESHLRSQIAVNSANQLFVGGGWRVSPVMSFSEEGDFIGFLGAEGEGPGEFKTSSSVVVGPRDSIYVFDEEIDRLLVFEPKTLQYVYSMNTIDSGSSISSPYKLLGVTEKGYLFKFETPYRPPGNALGIEPDEPRYSVINLLDRKGAIMQRSVAKLPAKERVVRTQGSSITVMSLPFGRAPFFVYKDRLLYTGWNDAIDISVISENGEEVRTVKIAHETVPISRREIEDQITTSSKKDRRSILRSKLLPETKPAYDALIVDDDGYLWIREYPDSKSEFAKWLVVGTDGKLIGEMELPLNLLLKTIKAGRAYASVNSEMHGPYIAVYSITR